MRDDSEGLPHKFVGDRNNHHLAGLAVRSETVETCLTLGIGFTPATNILKKLNITNEDGYIIVDNNMKTSINNIYAVGDVRANSPCQIITSMADGVVASLSIINSI